MEVRKSINKKNAQSTDISKEDYLVKKKKNDMLIFSQHFILITPVIDHQINKMSTYLF